jgi:hypothetical protein
MGIEFFANDEGRAILGVRSGPDNWVVRRKSVYHVNAAKLKDFASKYRLNDRNKARVALELNNFRSKYNLTLAIDSRPADAAIARWIGDLDKSIGRIAGAVEGEPEKFHFAFEAIEAAAWAWAKDNDDDTLHKMGFIVHRALGNVSQGIYEGTKNWFKQAALIRTFTQEAQKKLIMRNRSHGLKELLPDGPGKETYLYGAWLPLLYMRIMKVPFGISKDREGQRVKRTTGVAFVIEAAGIIGLSTTPANVADHYNKMKRFSKAQGARWPKRPKKMGNQPV